MANFRVQVLDNGYLLTVTEAVAGKGDVPTERSAYSTKAGLLARLDDILPEPSTASKGELDG